MRERERESDTKREEEREKALTTVARIDLAPSVLLCNVLWKEGVFYSKSFFNSLTDLHPFCSPRKIIRGISSISFICIFLLN